jgi:hypothetical protein
MCDGCGRGGRPGGYRAAVDALETHLKVSACSTGWYSYGGRSADRESVTVTLAGEKFTHRLRGKDETVAREADAA